MSESEAAVTRVIYGYTKIRSVTSSVLSYTADEPNSGLRPDAHTEVDELRPRCGDRQIEMGD